MPSLLLLVFILSLAIHLVNTVGAAAINELLWRLYNKLPTPTSNDFKAVVKLRREVVRLKTELNATSAQNEFAKWAKLQRQHDKALAEHDKKSQSLQSFKTGFDSTATIVRWVATTGLRFFLQFWYAKEPLFWFPRGWVPGYIEWLLAFPRAPRGSISIQIWGIACSSVIQLVSAAIASTWVLVMKTKGGQKGEPMKIGAGRGGGEKNEL